MTTIIETDAFLLADPDRKLELLSQPAQGSERPVFLIQAAQSVENMEMLLSDLLVNLGSEFSAKLLSIRDKYGQGILDFTLQKSPAYLSVLLNSKILEVMHKQDLYEFLAYRPKDYYASSLGKAIEKSLEHMQVYLNSKAIKLLNGEQLFQLLNLVSDEQQQLNCIWHVLLKGREYGDAFLNHTLFDKLDSNQTSMLLLAKYESDNSDTPLTYLVVRNNIEDLRSFLESAVFRKLNPEEKYIQYNSKNDNKLSALDVALKRPPEFLKELLDCKSCFNQLNEQIELELLTSGSGQESLSFAHKAFYISPEYIKVLLNSNEIVHMTQLAQFLSAAFQMEDYQTPDFTISHDLLKLQAIVESRAFESLDCVYQVALLGKETINLYETMIQPISENPYYFHCDEYF